MLKNSLRGYVFSLACRKQTLNKYQRRFFIADNIWWTRIAWSVFLVNNWAKYLPKVVCRQPKKRLQLDQWTDQWTDQQTHQQTDQQIDRRTICILLTNKINAFIHKNIHIEVIKPWFNQVSNKLKSLIILNNPWGFVLILDNPQPAELPPNFDP